MSTERSQMVEQIYSQQLQICLSMWTHLWKICIKNQQSSKATDSKGLFRDRWEKTSSPEFQLKGKYQSVPNTFLQHIANEKDIFSKLNRYISKISLKYIKLYNREILFLLPLTPPPQAGGRGCMSWKCGSSNMTNDDVINDYN